MSCAKTAEEIDASVNAGLDRLKGEVKGADKLLDDAKGVLVVPDVLQAGIGIGGEYGEGALRVGGKSVAYYRLISGSFGFQLGAQKKDVILLFMTDSALKKFRASNGWEAGVDGSVAVIKGVEGSLDTSTLKQPILGFVVGQKGLMYNLSLEGTKFTKLDK
jgi:lipid-binding SYLF domain-containing protein